MTQMNWSLTLLLFFLALPGVGIAVPRLIGLLLPDNSKSLQKRISFLAIIQTLVMVLLMSIAGTVLSLHTGFGAPVLEALIQGKSVIDSVQAMLLPVFVYTLGGLLIFFILYYGVVSSILDEATLSVLRKMRAALRLDGCVLYGGVAEEILARWGLLNVVLFFAILLAGHKTVFVIWSGIILSGMFFAIGHLPAFIAAGCQPSRRFIYTMLLLNCWQAILFGWIFWQYGLLAAIAAHMLFHLGWWLYDRT